MKKMPIRTIFTLLVIIVLFNGSFANILKHTSSYSLEEMNRYIHSEDRPFGLLGRVWFDSSQDGVMDPEEAGIFGMPIEVHYPLGTVLVEVDSWFDGWFEILTEDYPDLETYPELYLIPMNPENWAQHFPEDEYYTITLDDWFQPYYFGYNFTAPITGYVFEDQNADGIFQSDTEDGISDVQIEMRDPLSGFVYESTITLENGYYSFEIVPQDPEECTAPTVYDTFDPCYIETVTIEPWCCFASWTFDCDEIYSDCYFGRDIEPGDLHQFTNPLEYPGRQIDRYSGLHIYQEALEGAVYSIPEAGYHIWTYPDWGGEFDFGNVYASCGNGIIDAGEECDDGNTVNYDSCSSNCELEGDVVEDGQLNVSDIVLVVGMIVGQDPVDMAADVDGDGNVNVTDIVLLVCWITNCNQ